MGRENAKELDSPLAKKKERREKDQEGTAAKERNSLDFRASLGEKKSGRAGFSPSISMS